MQSQEPLNVAVTGAAGQIAYSFIPMLCSNTFFNRPLNLRLLDIPACLPILEGVSLELQDSNYNLSSLKITSDPKEAFENTDLCIMIGGFPRKDGMERKDLLKINGKIFSSQGEIMDQVANENCRILVVANPANTNAFILSHQFQRLKKENVTCLTRLDQNRAKGLLSEKLNISVNQIKKMVIWGNHSVTQVPDWRNAEIDGQKVGERIQDDEWLDTQFVPRVQKRGAEIIKARKGSSVFSAAKAMIDHLRDWFLGSDDFVSMGVVSQGQYGISKDIIFSYPCQCDGNFQYKVIDDIMLSEHTKQKLKTTEQELLDEKQEAIQ